MMYPQAATRRALAIAMVYWTEALFVDDFVQGLRYTRVYLYPNNQV